jgi:hypothetical protein
MNGLSAQLFTQHSIHLDILWKHAYPSPRMVRSGRLELLQGALDLLILRTLKLGPAHGHVKVIEHSSESVLLVERSSSVPWPAC